MTNCNYSSLQLLCFATLLFSLASCKDNISNDPFDNTQAVLLVIDEESIDNDSPPNDFSDVEVNDQMAEVGQRSTLQYFKDNTGKVIDLYTGQIGDEGWFALKTIPASWKGAGPTDNGSRNYLTAGPGLGTMNTNDEPEALLDDITDLTPMRATGLTMLKGQTVLAVVYDNDVNVNYSPLTGSLKGANLGIVAFDVIDVIKRNDGSSSSLPKVQIRVRDVDEVTTLSYSLFSNPPVLQSSDEPFDIDPNSATQTIELVPAQ